MNDTAIAGICLLMMGIMLCLSVVGSPVGLFFLAGGFILLNLSKEKKA
jgi:hypothetical protein